MLPVQMENMLPPQIKLVKIAVLPVIPAAMPQPIAHPAQATFTYTPITVQTLAQMAIGSP